MITELRGYVKATRVTLSRVTALVMAFAVLCAGSAFAASPTTYNVDIYDGSEITRVSTFRTEPEAIVKQADIMLGSDDVLDLDGFSAGEDSVITIYRAAKVSFVDLDGNVCETIFAGKVGGLLDKLGVTLNEDVLVNLPLNTVLSDGMTVRLQNAYHITVTADGITQEILLGEGTVSDALNEACVVLDDDDEVVPASDTALYDAMSISVLRVEYTERTETETVNYSNKNVDSDELYVGTTKVIQQGSNGSKQVTYADRIVNGEYESSTVVSETVTKPAVDKITAVGTKEKPKTVAALKNGGAAISELSVPSSLTIENGAPTSYKRVVTGKAAAYTASPSAKTASGRTVKPGYIAVDPNQFPYGTEMWIVSTDGIVYGYCIAADTGGFVKKGKFTVDLFMNSEQQCKQWGSRDVIIYVL